jgi:hypothetical protein
MTGQYISAIYTMTRTAAWNHKKHACRKHLSRVFTPYSRQLTDEQQRQRQETVADDHIEGAKGDPDDDCTSAGEHDGDQYEPQRRDDDKALRTAFAASLVAAAATTRARAFVARLAVGRRMPPTAPTALLMAVMTMMTKADASCCCVCWSAIHLVDGVV